MGVAISDILVREKISLNSMAGRKIAVDAYNTLYQFLSTIRQPDGTPLMDSKGRVTSHLTGLLYRTSKLMEFGLMPAFVFDGAPPEQKERTLEQRKTIRTKAHAEWEKAKEKGDLEEARKHAQASSRLTREMVDDAKKLLDAMGLPYIQAPAEGEAEAAYIAQQEDVWAAASQDYDSLLFGTPILIRNITLTGKRKLPGKNVYVTVEPEVIKLNQCLEANNITREQLVDIGILIGTDYNEGIKGIGPKKALKAIQEGKTLKEVYKEQNIEPDFDLDELREIFLKPDISKKYNLEWKKPDSNKMIELLVNEHDFSLDRVNKVIEKLTGAKEDSKGSQSRLDMWTK